jgi:phenylpropionate dioxygenase-like ring-hydroxylating dioxygenase large terminal subunit
LRNVPHEHGFPGLDKAGHGLVQVQAEERGGMVVVTQETGGSEPLCVPDDLLGPELEMVSVTEQEVAANWKVAAEGFIEGYHIFATHKGTFYPVQFDNLNVIEHFGRNSRVAYPYRNIQKLRTVPSGDRRTDGMLTYVYHLFPNVMVATFPKRVLMIVLEPQGPAATRYVTYTLAARATLQADRLAVERDEAFVDRGVKEDQDMVQSIQRGLASEANEAFVFGRFEAAIVHFHRNLHAALAETA